MSNDFDSVCGRCRRAGEKLFLKGEKCFTPKCPIVRRPYAPGVHGTARGKGRPGSGSEYGKQLREKQALRAMYGLREHQLEKYYTEALRKEGVTADILLRRLEARLDNVVFRLGYGASRAHARQLVNHGLFTVNGRRVDIPSYAVNVGDVVAIKETKRQKPVFLGLQERLANKVLPSWLERVDLQSGKVIAPPEMLAHEVPVDMQAIVEFYSR
jgi:small subunit ribosomal protein S4